MTTMSLMGLCEYAGTDWLTSALEEGLPSDFLQEVSAENLADYIVLENAELEILYSNPDFLHNAVALWAQAMKRPWSRYWKAITEDYDPLWNTDRHESETTTDTETRDLTDDSTAHGSSNENGSSGAHTTGSSTDKSNVKTGVSAYNSGSYAPKDSQDTDGSGTTKSDTSNTSQSASETSQDGTDRHTGTITHVNEHTHTAYGNIGVTTSQQMLQEELKLTPFLSFEKKIADDFKERFCLLVY